MKEVSTLPSRYLSEITAYDLWKDTTTDFTSPPTIADPEIFRHNVTSIPDVPNAVSVVREGLMSRETYELGQIVLDYFTYVLLLVGFVTNVINILVFTRPGMRSTSSHYLVAMSIVQLAYLTLDAIGTFYRLFIDDFLADFFFMNYILYAGQFGMTCFQRSQYVIHCLVSTERLLAVLVPLKAKNYVIMTKPVVFIVVSCVATFVGHFHVAAKYEVVEITRNNSTLPLRRYTSFYLDNFGVMEGFNVGAKIVFVYAALIYVVVTNVLMIIILGRHASKRRFMDTNVDKEAMRRRDTQMTVTILVSTLAFVALCLPLVTSSLVFNLLPNRYGPFSVEIWLFRFMQALGGTLFSLAMSTDFISYVALSTAYRNTLLGMLRNLNLLPLSSEGAVKKKVANAFSLTKESAVSSD